MFKKILVLITAFTLVWAVMPIGQTNAAGNQLSAAGFEQEGIYWDENGSEQGMPDKAYNWQNFGTGYTRVVYAGRPNTGWYGAKMVSTSTASMAGAFQRVDFNQTTIEPVFLGAYVKGENVTMAPGSYFGASLYAEIHLRNGQVVYWNTTANSGTFDWKWIGFNTAQLGSLISAPIDYVFVVPSIIRASGTAYFDDLNIKEVATTEATEAMMSDYVAPAPAPTPTPIPPRGCIIPFRWLCPR